MLRLTLLAAFPAAIVLAGCISTRPGDTLLRVSTPDPEEEKTLRRELWRVERAIADVRVRYGLEDITIEVEITDLGGLGQTHPAFSGLHVGGAKFVLNKRLFHDQHPDLDDIITGLTAHELAHALHYARMQPHDLVHLGSTYGSAMSHPEGHGRDWVRAYEQLTDMTAIALGYGEHLIHQKSASEANLAANHPPHVWDFYLKEPEIRDLMADRELLAGRIAAALGVLGLPSLEAFLEHPAFDDDGDLRRRSG